MKGIRGSVCAYVSSTRPEWKNARGFPEESLITIDLEQECHLVVWSESRRFYLQIGMFVIYISSILGLLLSC